MKRKLTLMYAPCNEIEVVHEPSIYAPNDYLYIVPDNTSGLMMARTIYQAEKEKNEWIRKYDRLLNGLNYWKNKALEND